MLYQGRWIIYFGESFSVSMDMAMISEKLYFTFMVWRNYSHCIYIQFYGEYVLTKCNVLFNNEHLILICFCLLIDSEFDLNITLKILNPEIIKNIDENPQNAVFFKIVFSIIVVFSINQNHLCYPNKEKCLTFCL